MQYTRYADVPWYRRSRWATLLAVSGFLCCPVLLWAVCALLLTGQVYTGQMAENGRLATWSWGNRIGAWAMLVVQTVYIVSTLIALWGRRLS